jgi:exodeoxyribonuclease III
MAKLYWLSDTEWAQSRRIEAAVRGVLVACIYLPNGDPQPGPKFDYKLAWFDRLIAHAARLEKAKLPTVLAGDFNAPVWIELTLPSWARGPPPP